MDHGNDGNPPAAGTTATDDSSQPTQGHTWSPRRNPAPRWQCGIRGRVPRLNPQRAGEIDRQRWSCDHGRAHIGPLRWSDQAGLWARWTMAVRYDARRDSWMFVIDLPIGPDRRRCQMFSRCFKTEAQASKQERPAKQQFGRTDLAPDGCWAAARFGHPVGRAAAGVDEAVRMGLEHDLNRHRTRLLAGARQELRVGTERRGRPGARRSGPRRVPHV